jgi:hypothetical protein
MNPEPTPGTAPIPHLELGTEVEICQDETMGVVLLGHVVAVNDGRRPNIVAIEVTDTELNFIGMKHCLHMNDPALAEKKEEIRQRSDRGVFRLSSREIRQRRLVEHYESVVQKNDGLRRDFDEARAALTMMEQRLGTAEEALKRVGQLRSKRVPAAAGSV